MQLDKSELSAPLLPLNAPLVVSITGHRDPLNTATLEAVFRAELKNFNPKPTRDNCICLSSLAEGADTLAAAVAADEGWQVIAPLPLPLEEYRKDFEGAALEKFNRLIEVTPHFFVGYAKGCDENNTVGYTPFRDLQYAHMGEFLVRHSEVLFAFWDGLDALGAGGTGDVVTMQLQGIPASLTTMRREGTLLDAPEGGRVVQIWTARAKHESMGVALPDSHGHGTISRDGEVVTQTTRLRAQTAGELRGVGGQTSEHRETRREEWNRFVEDMKGNESSDEYGQIPLDLALSSPYLMQVRDQFLRADARAGELQGRVNKRFGQLMWLALGFTFSVSVASAYQETAWRIGLLLVTWAFLLALRGLPMLEQKDKIATRYQDYRAIAEAWRIAFFWRAIGVHDALDTSYFRYQRGELDWIRQALRTADLQWRARWGYPVPTPQAFDQTREDWIGSQAKYFARKFPRERQNLTRLRNWSWAFLMLGLCASAIETVAQLSAAGVLNSGNILAIAGNFATTFVSADLLSSPLLPAVLLLMQMEGWPLATESNTRDLGADTPDEIRNREKLRRWFVYQNFLWRIGSVGVALLVAVVGASIYVGQLSGDWLIPILRLTETMCFFLPALVFVYAEFHGLAEAVARSEQMSSIFARAEQMLRELPPDWDAQKREEQERRIYRELGREALHENGEWLLLHRERPLDIDA